MRSLQVQDHGWDDDDAHSRAAAPALVTAVALAAPDSWTPGVRWSDRRSGVNWPCAAAAIGFSSALLVALVTANVVAVPFMKREPTVVRLVELPIDPPEVAPPPEPKVEPVKEIQPVVIAPKAIVQTPPIAPPPLQTVADPPPVRAAVTAPAQDKPVIAPPVPVADLSSKVISQPALKYPVESRRKREQGTVVLMLLLSTTGSVAEISVSKSSGFPRLDKAALDGVRRWKWSPTVVNGQPVQVRGVVPIPFVLEG